MTEYKILQQGGQNDAQEVMRLQQALAAEGYTQVGEADGIYGARTAGAVRDYQARNGLTVDGIAGNETLSHLYQKDQAPAEDGAAAPEEAEKAPSSGELYAGIQATLAQQQEISQGYQQQLQALYEQITSRPGYSYNVNEDALFAQYADAYQRGGRLAMEDAMGQAAALTGGYGSSYGQSVGQQAYQQYMSALNEKIPALEQQAYSRYQQEGQDLLDQYGLLWQQANDAFDRYNTDLQQQWQNLTYTQGREDLTWEREQASQDDRYNKLVSLISIGYKPTQEELSAAGITQAQADAILANYNASRYSGKSGSNPITEVTASTGFTGTTYRDAVLYLEENAATGYGWEKLLPEYDWNQQKASGQATGRVAACNSYQDYLRSYIADQLEMRDYAQKQTQFKGSTHAEAVQYLQKHGISEYVMTQEDWEEERAEYLQTGKGHEFVTEHSSYPEFLRYYIAYLLNG